MINHVFISVSAIQLYNLSFNHLRELCFITDLTIFNDWWIGEIHNLLIKTLTLKQTNNVIKSDTTCTKHLATLSQQTEYNTVFNKKEA